MRERENERWLQPAGVWSFAGFMGDGYGNAEEEVREDPKRPGLAFLDLNESDTPSLDREREVLLGLQGDMISSLGDRSFFLLPPSRGLSPRILCLSAFNYRYFSMGETTGLYVPQLYLCFLSIVDRWIDTVIWGHLMYCSGEGKSGAKSGCGRLLCEWVNSWMNENEGERIHRIIYGGHYCSIPSISFQPQG